MNVTENGLVYGADAYITGWVADHIPGVSEFSAATAIGVATSGKLICGVVYHDYIPEHRTIQVSIAAISPMWAKRAIIRDLLAYPFFQLNCYRVHALVSVDNTRAVKVCENIGFVREALLSSVFGQGKDGISFRMLLPEYQRKFYNGKIQTNTTESI